MSSNGSLYTPPPNPLRMILIVAVAALAFAWFLRTSQPPQPQGEDVSSPNIGKPFPELTVEGWINGPGPAAADMTGKVRVIEAWAYWCGPCIEAAPHLRELYEKYHSRGVVFVGLTGEGAENLSRSQKFVEQGQITWPNGYGADQILAALEVHGIPHLWVVDKEGKIAWEGHPLALPEGLLDRLLK
jgi:thiol-disulfide isomerase/thioredoxin